MSTFSKCVSYLEEMAFRIGLDPKGDNFRRIAYEKAHETLKASGTLDGVGKLKGIGKSMMADFKEIETTGTCAKLVEARKNGPPVSVMELLRVRGIGPKTAAKLYASGISSLEALGVAIKSHKINDPKLVQAFYESQIASVRVARVAVEIAIKPVLEFIRSFAGVSQAECMGSYRRHRPDVRDVDVLVTIDDLTIRSTILTQKLSKHFNIEIRMDGAGRKAYLDMEIDGAPRQLDLNFCEPQEQGCAMLHFTGSKDFNIACRNVAERKGFKLNQYSVSKLDSNKSYQFETEKEVLKFLGIPYVEPECRDYYLLQTPVPPPVVDVDEIIADLHTHTTSSDGKMNSTQLVNSARALKYKAIGFSDHSQGSGNGLKEDAAVARALKIKDRRNQGDIKLLAGVELDVRANGALDYSIESLANFDYVLLSLHAVPERETEKRICKAVADIRRAHPKLALAWAHPTGRIIGSRIEADVDWGKVFRFMAKHNVAIEINGQTSRLDLPDSKIVVAQRLNCKFLVSSDSHGKTLDPIDPAVMLARRALLQRTDVINASTASLAAWLRGE